MSSRDLRPVGPLEMLDRALALAREGGWESAGRAWAGGGVLALACIGLYDVERVEGVRSLRPLFALGIVLAWWLRAWVLSGEAAARVHALWGSAPDADGGRRVLSVVRTASVVGLGLWCWVWILAGAVLISPAAAFFALPVFAVRGAVAPSWIARAGRHEEGGWRGFLAAFRDSDDRRAAGFWVELAVLVGAMGLFANLYGALVVIAVLGRSFLGIDLALADAFLSPTNSFVWLIVAAATLVLLEPLRAAVSAAAYVDARVRQDGLDLRVSIDEAIGARARRDAARGRVVSAVGVVLVLLAGACAAPAIAQDLAVKPPESSGIDHDDHVREEVSAILRRPEFQEFADSKGHGIRDLLEALFKWLSRDTGDPDARIAPRPSVNMPLPPVEIFLALGALLLGLVLAYVVFARARKTEPAPTDKPRTAEEDPRERAPTEFLDDAALLARQGRYRDALRALYLATLVSLDRRRLIVFDPHHTNGRYLRQMPKSAAKAHFSEFTRRFDHAWYGGAPATEEDYRACRVLADRVCADEEQAA